MLSHMLKATGIATTHKATSTGEEVLPHCPYHNQIIFARAAVSTFVAQQGLDDFKEYFIRKEIQDHRKSVAIEEIIYREDMRMFFTGIGRILNVARESFQLVNVLRKSDNWLIEWRRVKQVEPMSFGMHAYTTYGQVMQMYNDGQFEEAGEALSLGLFPTQ